MNRRFRIHPCIGVARVGNAPEAHFIGPEQPGRPANWGTAGFDSFRDDKDRIKRQAARFRVFEYDEDAQGRLANPREVAVAGEIAAIEWRVHLANKKASFFVFNGQSGAADAYIGRSKLPADHPEKAAQAKAKDQGKKKLKEDPARPNLRNASVPAADRKRLLEIDPGERLISTRNPAPVPLTNPNEHVPFIPDLGELRLDGSRLIVLGGHGVSGSTQDPEVEINEYANNDTWFDDVGDGPVKARIVFADDRTVDADPAWVLVGPPDFAPGMNNIVTLFDTLLDIAVRHLPVPTDNQLFVDGPLQFVGALKRALKPANKLAGYSPSFVREIYPIFSRAFSARWVFDPGEMDKGSFHVQFLDWNRVADPSDAARAFRRTLFDRIRDPGSKVIDWHGMPRGLGDDYDHLDDPKPKPSGLLSLTSLQYALLEQWVKGDFVNDWPGFEPDIPEPQDVTPDGLDRAALEGCVGGPFYPGIEISWLVRRPEMYSEPFRLRAPRQPEVEITKVPPTIGALTFAAGFFSQQMALPWQADFYDCHKEQRESTDNRLHYYMWWTAQRPDDVFPAKSGGKGKQAPWVARFIPDGSDFDDFEGENERFRQIQKNWHTLRFVIRTADKKFEEEPDA